MVILVNGFLLFVLLSFFFFFFNDTATTEIYTLSLHDALPISALARPAPRRLPRAGPGKLGLRGDRVRRAAAARPARLARTGLGWPVTDHAAEAGRASAARPGAAAG